MINHDGYYQFDPRERAHIPPRSQQRQSPLSVTIEMTAGITVIGLAIFGLIQAIGL
jgi:hypothetical protein